MHHIPLTGKMFEKNHPKYLIHYDVKMSRRPPQLPVFETHGSVNHYTELKHDMGMKQMCFSGGADIPTYNLNKFQRDDPKKDQ